MNYQAQYWDNKLTELEKRVTSVEKVPEDTLKDWVAECVATFSFLGVSSDVIRGFMNVFEFVGADYYISSSKWKAVYDSWQHPAAKERRVTGFFYPNIAFTTTRQLLEKVKEQERLVPETLINLLKQRPNYTNLANSLESMELAYQSKDPDNLLSASGALLGSIMGLHTDQKLQSLLLKKQLEFLTKKSNGSILADFGVDPELVELLHNFRYLRNVLSQHKRKYSFKPPLSVSYGFAALVLLFLYGTMARGVLITV